MTTDSKHTADQLRLAATILETGHPWERKSNGHIWIKTEVTPLNAIAHGDEIRLALATPPDGRPLHNPDNLDAEKVGAGYRLVCYDDSTHADKLEKWMGGEWVAVHTIGQLSFRHCQSTYRLPLSAPWPESKPDPYAELKTAHAAGKVIQFKPHSCPWEDSDSPDWTAPLYCYRIKPEEPFQLPPPPPGMKWHREDEWRPGDLPPGYRPLVFKEKQQAGDEFCADGRWRKIPESAFGDESFSSYNHRRTRRPLTFEHAGKMWTWHRPGDPMPCDGERKVEIVMRDIEIGTALKAKHYEWGAIIDSQDAEIIGWRYAEPETKEVELGPEDVKPFTVIRRKGEVQSWHWRTVSYVDAVKVTCGNRGYGWDELASDYERNESLPLTGKWNPDAWEPCKKIIAVEKP